jgi:uncharacterized protein (DUF58 family)
MEAIDEFHYRLGGAAGGFRPGAHAGTSLGAGQEFAAHARLFDHPDPRRIDLRASLRDARGEWLVRTYRQRASVPVHAVVDVSASMAFGAGRAKLDVVADFAESLGRSAFRAGDPVGLMAFDCDHADPRDALYVPARHSRGVGAAMADALRRCAARPDPGHARRIHADGAAFERTLERTLERLAGKAGLVFLVSDFHWPLAPLAGALDLLAHASVVPVVVWDPAEIEPPADDVLLALRDAESGARRTLWVGSKMRALWRANVAQRRSELDALFATAGMRPFYLLGGFDPEALSRHFLEGEA